MADLRTETRATARLALPIAAANLGNQLLGLVDTAVVGRLGEIPLGAVGLGNSLYFGITVVGLGLMLGLDPLLAQHVGAGEHQRAHHTFWQGGWIAAMLTAPLALLLAGVVLLLEPFGIDRATAVETGRYVYARLPGLFFFLLIIGGRSFLQAHSVTRPIIVSMVVANVINLPLSWALVFGDAGLVRFGVPPLGIPSLGAAGAAWTSTVCTVIQCAIVLWAAGALDPAPGSTGRTGRTGRAARRPDRAIIRRALSIGAPIGLALLAEVGLFAIVGVLMGVLGTRPLAAHNVAVLLVSTTFQVPLAIGAAASVRVGLAVGRGDVQATRTAGLAAIGIVATFMSCTSAVFVLVPEPLGRLITDELPVVRAAVPLIWVAAAFQIGDGIQAVAAGALRGAGDTRFAMIANLLGHYVVGLPVGVYLTWVAGWGAPGLWWALTAGLTTVAVALAWRFLRISAGAISRA